MKKAVIDFESYYDDQVGVSNLGNHNYFKKADAYIVGIEIDGEITAGTIAEMGPMMEQVAKDPTVQPWAANSNFDQGWSDKYGWKFQQDWRCVLDLGVYHQLPRDLARLSKQAIGGEMDKSIRDQMKGVRFEGLSKEEQDKVVQYCMEDVRRESLTIAALPPMSAMEEAIAAHTRLQSRRGVYVDRALVLEDKGKLQQMHHDSFKAIPWHRQAKPLSAVELARWCETEGIPTPRSTAKTSDECTLLMSQHPKLNEVMLALRRYRGSNMRLTKLETLLERVTEDNILPMDLFYCGAPHTRRWSSRGFNIQNLDKEPLDCGNGTSVWTRNWIKPRPGYVFYIADYAQVEPRVLNWLAGNDALLDAIRSGGFSYYEAYARAARGWNGAAGTIKTEYGKAKYTLLKNECLGCGFGMGAAKFVDYAAQNGAVVSMAEAQRIVGDFRRRNPKIPQLWAKMDNIIRNAARDKDKHFAIDMPTGDTLQYFNVRQKKGGYEGFVIKGDYGHDSLQPRLWGGTLTENITQRMARDVMAEASLRIEQGGWPVAWTSHDEIIVEVRDTEADRAAAAVELPRIMKQAPEWAPTLPLDVEATFEVCYTK